MKAKKIKTFTRLSVDHPLFKMHLHTNATTPTVIATTTAHA